MSYLTLMQISVIILFSCYMIYWWADVEQEIIKEK